jgi:hypothetical protein
MPYGRIKGADGGNFRRIVTMQKGQIMKHASQPTICALAFLLLAIAFAGCLNYGRTAAIKKEGGKAPVTAAVQARVQGGYDRLPLSFEANQGQTDPRVQFLARGRGYTLFVTQGEAVLVLHQKRQARGKEGVAPFQAALETATQTVVRMRLEGANPSPRASGLEPLPGIVNYFAGNDPKMWRTNIPTYKKIEYKGIYPGIDLAYYGNQGELEYDLIVAPGADPSQIKLALEGAEEITLADSGELILTTNTGHVRLQKPLVYQLHEDGHKELIAGNYLVHPRPITVSFQLAAYDNSKPLIIDPLLVYSSYLGGLGGDGSRDIAVDADGNAYITGPTHSTNFPTTTGAFQATFNAGGDAFVTKLNSAGSALLYSTYLGGTNNDEGFGIALDTAGNAYVTGPTFSTDFPTTAGAFQTTFGGNRNAFVTKLNSTGSALVYSTYLGGSGEFDQGRDIAVDGDGSAYVTGETSSTDFPTTAGAVQPTLSSSEDSFVTKLDPTGSTLLYSTYLGGGGSEMGRGIAVDGIGNAYVTGKYRLDKLPDDRRSVSNHPWRWLLRRLRDKGESDWVRACLLHLPRRQRDRRRSRYCGGRSRERLRNG